MIKILQCSLSGLDQSFRVRQLLDFHWDNTAMMISSRYYIIIITNQYTTLCLTFYVVRKTDNKRLGMQSRPRMCCRVKVNLPLMWLIRNVNQLPMKGTSLGLGMCLNLLLNRWRLISKCRATPMIMRPMMINKIVNIFSKLRIRARKLNFSPWLFDVN